MRTGVGRSTGDGRRKGGRREAGDCDPPVPPSPPTIYFVYRTQMTLNKRTKTVKQYKADFSLNRKQTKSFVLRHLCPVHEVLTDYFISQFQLMESFF